MNDPRKFYKAFRMRRSVFTMLHDTLVDHYGLKSTSQMSSGYTSSSADGAMAQLRKDIAESLVA
jgi:hypothetical protein